MDFKDCEQTRITLLLAIHALSLTNALQLFDASFVAGNRLYGKKDWSGLVISPRTFVRSYASVQIRARIKRLKLKLGKGR